MRESLYSNTKIIKTAALARLRSSNLVNVYSLIASPFVVAKDKDVHHFSTGAYIIPVALLRTILLHKRSEPYLHHYLHGIETSFTNDQILRTLATTRYPLTDRYQPSCDPNNKSRCARTRCKRFSGHAHDLKYAVYRIVLHAGK